ncbi:MAG: hypothetical protein PGN29_19090 [Gordonia paraffinivorans]
MSPRPRVATLPLIDRTDDQFVLTEIFFRHKFEGSACIEVIRTTNRRDGAVSVAVEVDGFAGQPVDVDVLYVHLGAARDVRDRVLALESDK